VTNVEDSNGVVLDLEVDANAVHSPSKKQLPDERTLLRYVRRYRTPFGEMLERLNLGLEPSEPQRAAEWS
jgi:hypothetical protein